MRFSDSYHAPHNRRPQAQTCDILHIRRRNAGYLARKQDAKSDAEIDRSFDTDDQIRARQKRRFFFRIFSAAAPPFHNWRTNCETTISRCHSARNVLIPNPLGIVQLSPKPLTVIATHLTFNQGVVGSSSTALTS